jgi:hypothetical protein
MVVAVFRRYVSVDNLSRGGIVHGAFMSEECKHEAKYLVVTDMRAVLNDVVYGSTDGIHRDIARGNHELITTVKCSKCGKAFDLTGLVPFESGDWNKAVIA